MHSNSGAIKSNSYRKRIIAEDIRDEERLPGQAVSDELKHDKQGEVAHREV